MLDPLNRFLDWLSEFLAVRRGLLPIIGILLVILNWVLRVTFVGSPLVEADFLLHLGIVVAVFGLMLARAL